MEKQRKMKRPSSALGQFVETAPDDPAPVFEPTDGSASFEDVARVAYALWEARGCPDGSPEEDWFRAEKQLQQGRSRRAFA